MKTRVIIHDVPPILGRSSGKHEFGAALPDIERGERTARYDTDGPIDSLQPDAQRTCCLLGLPIYADMTPHAQELLAEYLTDKKQASSK
jgi:hypothetical protein